MPQTHSASFKGVRLLPSGHGPAPPPLFVCMPLGLHTMYSLFCNTHHTSAKFNRGGHMILACPNCRHRRVRKVCNYLLQRFLTGQLQWSSSTCCSSEACDRRRRADQKCRLPPPPPHGHVWLDTFQSYLNSHLRHFESQRVAKVLDNRQFRPNSRVIRSGGVISTGSDYVATGLKAVVLGRALPSRPDHLGSPLLWLKTHLPPPPPPPSITIPTTTARTLCPPACYSRSGETTCTTAHYYDVNFTQVSVLFFSSWHANHQPGVQFCSPSQFSDQRHHFIHIATLSTNGFSHCTLIFTRVLFMSLIVVPLLLLNQSGKRIASFTLKYLVGWFLWLFLLFSFLFFFFRS